MLLTLWNRVKNRHRHFFRPLPDDREFCECGLIREDSSVWECY